MDGPGFDTKFEDACTRLSPIPPMETLVAVSNLNQLIVDQLVREHPALRDDGHVDYDAARRLWKQHERTHPTHQHG